MLITHDLDFDLYPTEWSVFRMVVMTLLTDRPT